MNDLDSIMERYNAWLTGVVVILAAVAVMGHLIKIADERAAVPVQTCQGRGL